MRRRFLSSQTRNPTGVGTTLSCAYLAYPAWQRDRQYLLNKHSLMANRRTATTDLTLGTWDGVIWLQVSILMTNLVQINVTHQGQFWLWLGRDRGPCPQPLAGKSTDFPEMHGPSSKEKVGMLRPRPLAWEGSCVCHPQSLAGFLKGGF